MGPISLILLDVNETLSDTEPLRAVFESVGAPPRTLESWFAATLRDGFALAAAGGYADFESLAADAIDEQLLDLPPTAREAGRAAVLGAFRELGVHPDVAEGLEAARRSGFAVATLTNGSTAYTQGLLRRSGLDELVDATFDVGEAGRWKPAPEPYLHAAEASGRAPEEMALVAVHPWDLEGARRVGARTGWLNRSGRPYPSASEPPDVEGRTLAEVVERLAALS